MSLPGPVPDDRLLFAIDRKAAGHGNTEIAGRAALPAANVIGLTWLCALAASISWTASRQA